MKKTAELIPDSLESAPQNYYQTCEEKIRKAPMVTLMGAFAAGYLLRSLPVTAIAGGVLRLTMALVKPALITIGTARIYQWAQKNDLARPQ